MSGSVRAALENKGKSLSGENDAAISPNKECLTLVQGDFHAILIFQVKLA
jgi:hypothetical protein